MLKKRNQERISILNSHENESVHQDIFLYREKITELSSLSEVPNLHLSWVKSKVKTAFIPKPFPKLTRL